MGALARGGGLRRGFSAGLITAPRDMRFAVPAGARCDGGSGPRLLTLAECMAFARLPPHAHAYKFIGTQVERSEFPGCILWKGKYVEFNDHRLQRRGCNVHAQQGECLCTSAP